MSLNAIKQGIWGASPKRIHRVLLATAAVAAITSAPTASAAGVKHVDAEVWL
jgi:hypothetical protein